MIDDVCGTMYIEYIKMVTSCSEVHEQALLSCDAIHHERRILLKQEIGRMVLFFTDQPSLLAPNIQVRFHCRILLMCFLKRYAKLHLFKI